MKIQDIQKCRVDTVIPIPTDELSTSTLSEARDLLGYVPSQEEEKYPDSLSDALAELGIEILNWRQVVTYQAEAVHEARMIEIRQMESLGSNRGSWAFKSWEQTPLKDWKAPIPLHIIERANQIKKRCPEVEFFVEHLSKTPDPFLVAKIKHATRSWQELEYFIDVWEEPKFENR